MSGKFRIVHTREVVCELGDFGLDDVEHDHDLYEPLCDIATDVTEEEWVTVELRAELL